MNLNPLNQEESESQLTVFSLSTRTVAGTPPSRTKQAV
jgi:hypothetical protein